MFTSQRHVVRELMDDPSLDPSTHAAALAGLRRINAISNAAAQMALPIIHYAHREKLDRLTMLDIACGGGDVPVAITKLLEKAGIATDLTLLDCSATSLNLASTTAR